MPQGGIVLLGDKDQLASVQAGAIFAELARHTSFTAAMADHLSEETGISPTLLQPMDSAFNNIALVLPENDSPVLSRELIYTAITRAKQGLALYGALDVLLTAVGRPTIRRSGLAAKVNELGESIDIGVSLRLDKT